MYEDNVDCCFSIKRDTLGLRGIGIAIVKTLEEGG